MATIEGEYTEQNTLMMFIQIKHKDQEHRLLEDSINRSLDFYQHFNKWCKIF